MPDTKTVEGVEIFAQGVWTDSQGQEREWTGSDLDVMLKNFNTDSGEFDIPVKVGHTDDDFNTRVANELNIPKSLVTGDDGNGAPRLGKMANVRRDGDKLIADFVDVPFQITDMIEGGMYNAVSVEIDLLEDNDPHLSGVAILGAELPAVDSLASLSQSSVYSHMAASVRPWITLRFAGGQPEQVEIDPDELAIEFREINSKMEDVIRGKKGAKVLRAFWSEIQRRMSQLTGKQFSQYSHYGASDWESIIENQRSSTLNIPLETIAKISPEMGGSMGSQGLTKLKIKGFELPDELKVAFLNLGGEADEEYFSRLMAMDMGIEGGDKLALCALLTKEKTGNWPILDNGGDSSNITGQSQSSEGVLMGEFGERLGARLRNLLEEKNLTLDDFATRVNRNLNTTGSITASTLGQIVRGDVERPGDEVMSAIARALDVSKESLENLVAGEGEKSRVEQGDVMNEFVLAPEDLPRLYEALGLDDTATIEDVLAAIAAMQGGGEVEGEGEMPPMEMPMSEEDKDKRIAELEARLTATEGFAKELTHERLVMNYTKQATAWGALSGTAEERGSQLAKIHESAGEDIAKSVASQYKAANDAALEAGVLKSVGATSKPTVSQPDDFHDMVEEYAKANGMSFHKALAGFATKPEYRAEFADYRERVRSQVTGGN